MKRDWLFILGFMLFMAFFGWLWGGQCVGLYCHYASRSWVPVKASIVRITFGDKSARMVYRYDFGGETFTNDNLRYLSPGTIPDMSLIGAKYKVGQQITVSVNPKTPDQAVVIRRELRSSELAFNISGLAFVSAIIFWFVWTAAKHFRAGMKANRLST